MNKWCCVSFLATVSLFCGTGRLMAQATGDIGDTYMVITLPETAGGSSSVAYLHGVPGGGWTDDYKTNSLVLKRVPRGSFGMGPGLTPTTIPNDFYIGVFEVTVGQFARFSTLTPAAGDWTNTEAITYDVFKTKGGEAGFLGGLTASVDPNDLPTTNTVAFALPPGAEWEYACRAGSSPDYYYGDDDTLLGGYAWYNGNSGGVAQEAGQLTPNGWALYDMLGNVAELVAGGVDMRGGAYGFPAADCMCVSSVPWSIGLEGYCGFRVYIEIPTDYLTLTVTSGTGGGNTYTNGETVAITANAAPANKQFDCWTGNVETVADVTAESTTLVMPGSNITVNATYKALPYLTVVNGTGSGYYTNGVTVSVTSTPTNTPWMFNGWTSSGGSVVFADATAETTTFSMPAMNTTVTATYRLRPTLTVVDGISGSGQYDAGEVVTISAVAPPAHFSFRWAGNPIAEAAVADLTSWNTTVTMPGADITLTATYTVISYPVTVTGGTGGGSYTNGHVVTITANPPPSAQHVFNEWVGDTAILGDPASPATTLTVDVAAKVAATYRPVPVLDRTYLVVDLTAAGKASYTNEAPVGGWNTGTYKSTSMVFQKVPVGTFTMGGIPGVTAYAGTAHQVTLTEVFYMGLFPVTQAQWYCIRGQWPDSFYSGPGRDERPVERVSYEALRGANQGTNWPASAEIDSSSFISAVRTRAGTGFNFDLPTEAQWEYTCRAETTTPYSFSDPTQLGNYAWFLANASGTTQPVGGRLPNPWGFYDMHGNVNEWCLDWYSGDYGSAAVTNPKGGTGSASNFRIVRGGSFSGQTNNCFSAYRSVAPATNALLSVGFRLAWTVGAEYPLAVTNGIVNTGGNFVQGMQIPITAEDRSPAWKFLRWEVLPAGTSLGTSFNANNVNTLVTMPNKAVAVTAVYEVNDTYTALTVVNGTQSGSGAYTNGTVVTIVADAPADVMNNLWYEFDCWTGTGTGNLTGLADATAPTTTFTAKGGTVTLTATYKILDPLPPDVHLLTIAGNGVTKIVPVRENDSETVTAPPPPSASFAFGWWEIDPDGADLGSTFSETAQTTSVTMPAMDVTLSAIYVKDPGPTPGYLNLKLVDSTTLANLAGALWSTDGKDFIAAASADYPLKPGTYTLRFKAPDLNWLTPANVKVTIKAGQTTTLTVPFVWVPVVTGIVSGGDPKDTVALSPANGQVLPGKSVTLTAKPSKESVFVEWTDGVLTVSRQEAPATNTTYTAIFRLKSSYINDPVLSPGTGTAIPTVGVLYSHTVGINERPATFKASKLPAGLKINSATGEIYGVPTVKITAVTTFPVTVTATNPNKRSSSETVLITIAPLSPYAQGAFTGYLTNGVGEVSGTFTMKASAAGVLSVKATVRNAAVSFSTKGWLETDGTVYTAQFLTKKLEALGLTVDTSAWSVAGTTSGGKIGTDVLALTGCWDVFKVNKKLFPADYTFAMAELAKYQGYYTVALPVTACAMLTPGLDNVQEGAGYLTLTVNKTGGVKVAGSLSDGTKLSASTTLLYAGTEALVPVFAPLYGKRGVACGLLSVLPGGTAPDDNKVAPASDWQWSYPGKSAAAALDGFDAALEPFGAFYAKLSTIEAYYSGASLTTAVDTESMEIPLVFNAKGVASLTTEVTDNPIGAKLTVKPATGLFNGTFLRIAPSATKPATVKYLGVLTRDGGGDPVGYGAYVLPQTEKVGSTSYSLKPSYPVTIE